MGRIAVKQTNRNQQIILEVGDISEKKTNTIVSPVNGRLTGGGTVDEAILKKAGKGLNEERADIFKNQLGNEQMPTGQAIITSGHDLPIEYVIHARGPVWNGEKKEKKQKWQKLIKIVYFLQKNMT